jgi:hypothetical protein
MPHESEKRAAVDPMEIGLVNITDREEDMDREGWIHFPRPNGQLPGWFAQCLGLFGRFGSTNFEDMFCQQHPALDSQCKLLPLEQRRWNRELKLQRRRGLSGDQAGSPY